MAKSGNTTISATNDGYVKQKKLQSVRIYNIANNFFLVKWNFHSIDCMNNNEKE